VFTCRIPGIYWFYTSLTSDVDGSHNNCYIKLNGSLKGLAFIPDYVGTFETGAVSEVFRLNHGDRVQVGSCWNATKLFANFPSNSFSGVLVKPDE